MENKKNNQTGKHSKPITPNQVYTLKNIFKDNGEDIDFMTEGEAGVIINEYKRFGMRGSDYLKMMNESKFDNIEKEFRRKQSEATGFSDYDAVMFDTVNEYKDKIRKLKGE